MFFTARLGITAAKTVSCEPMRVCCGNGWRSTFRPTARPSPRLLRFRKGHYLPTFRLRQSEPAPAPFPLRAETVDSPVNEAAATPAVRRWDYWKSTPLGLALGVLLVLVLAGSAFLATRARPRATADKSAVDVFWAPFLSGDPPVVIYSNARFLGDSKTGLRYAPAGAPSERTGG